jgi:hypothetical protein
MDSIGPMPETKQGNLAIFTVVDRFQQNSVTVVFVILKKERTCVASWGGRLSPEGRIFPKVCTRGLAVLNKTGLEPGLRTDRLSVKPCKKQSPNVTPARGAQVLTASGWQGEEVEEGCCIAVFCCSFGSRVTGSPKDDVIGFDNFEQLHLVFQTDPRTLNSLSY